MMHQPERIVSSLASADERDLTTEFVTNQENRPFLYEGAWRDDTEPPTSICR